MILFSIIGGLILFVIFIVVIYFFLIFIGIFILVNRKFKFVKNGIDIFVSINGMYVDYIVFIQNQLFDWIKIIDGSFYVKLFIEYLYFGIGWGDLGFYFELEIWDNLFLRIVVKVMFYFIFIIMYVMGYEILFYDIL